MTNKNWDVIVDGVKYAEGVEELSCEGGALRIDLADGTTSLVARGHWNTAYTEKPDHLSGKG